MNKPQAQNILRPLYRLADADMVFWLMPVLMLLLVAGTLAQRWMGLWPALEKYFSGFILWVGPIPLPGAYTILSIISLNLLAKFLLKSEWRWQKAGINLAHLGVIILLFGALLTAMTARETYMLIPEGQETPYTYSYTGRTFSIYEDDTLRLNLPYDHVKNWDFSALPFQITLTKNCDNCEILKRAESPDYNEETTYQAMAQFMALAPKPVDPQPETNLTGFEFNITGSENDGHYLAFDGMPKPIEITAKGKTYKMIFGKTQHTLPFAIALKDFVKDNYAGTEMARAYHSDVIIKDGAVQWPARIEMNKPLRYKGYTFFQSSFEQAPGFEATILAVVKNKGRLFPYIATLIIAAGLLLHLVITLRGHKTA